MSFEDIIDEFDGSSVPRGEHWPDPRLAAVREAADAPARPPPRMGTREAFRFCISDQIEQPVKILLESYDERAQRRSRPEAVDGGVVRPLVLAAVTESVRS
ncbi:hypothetical protein [Streptomyces sp. NPDC059491]|uniref:hypothetical protein n=1 Tax=Streptomyces sp. NPDC059491 TaxID=3346850 RepID=UPI003690C55E